jgi:toxin FitB
MGFLLDTTALSELTKRRPNPGFGAWLERQDRGEAFIGTLTFGELESGIQALPLSPKRKELQKWITELGKTFEARILSFDLEAARAWGRALAKAGRLGKSLAIVDSQLAAIAFTKGIAVVTHNVRHFKIDEFTSLEIIDPWT